ncbi:MAG: hypothetical protein KKA54_09495 [Proteobacteria bacterium]|nr:hypothetical protein [Pseudomonadota bacterium]MBU0966601.1 hypothetical protein [Pseudomonadota bacterium]
MALMKFGWILLREGLIQRKQMENILNLQKKHQDMLFGELASHYFSVPEEEVEAVFANHVLIPFVEKRLLEELRRKVKVEGMNVEEFICGVEVELAGFTRKIIRSSFYNNDRDRYSLGSGSVALQIIGTTRLDVHTAVNESLVFEDVEFEVKMASLEMHLTNPHLLTEAKLRLMQLFKKQISQPA